MGTLPCFSAIFTKGNNFRDIPFASRTDRTFLIQSLLLKGKHFQEQEKLILGFKSRPLLRREAKTKKTELFPLECTYTH